MAATLSQFKILQSSSSSSSSSSLPFSSPHSMFWMSLVSLLIRSREPSDLGVWVREIEAEGEQNALVTMRHLSTSAFLKHTPPSSYFCCTSRTAQLKRHDWKIVYNNNLVENKMTLYNPVHLCHQSTHCAAALMSLEYRLHNDSFVTNPHVLSTKDYRNVIIQVSPLLSCSM